MAGGSLAASIYVAIRANRWCPRPFLQYRAEATRRGSEVWNVRQGRRELGRAKVLGWLCRKARHPTDR